MFGTSELDKRNIYSPNLQDINEYVKRTYGKANSLFEKEEFYLQYLEEQLKL